MLVKAAAGGGGRGMSVVEDEAELRSRCPPPAARPWPRSATAGSTSSGSSATPATSRCRCSADKHGNVIHIGERDCTAAAPPPEGRRGVTGAEHPARTSARTPAERRRLRRGPAAGQRGDRRVHLRRRHVHLRLPGVQRAHPGGAPGERDGLRGGPRGGAAPVRGGGAPALPAGRHRPRRPRGRGPDHHRGPGPRLHAASGDGDHVGATRRVRASAVDSHCEPGYVVTPYYDSLLAKIVAHGPDRDTALDRMVAALGALRVEGVPTTTRVLPVRARPPRLPRRTCHHGLDRGPRPARLPGGSLR